MFQRIQRAFVEEITKIAFGSTVMPQSLAAKPPVSSAIRPMSPPAPPPRPQTQSAATGLGASALGLMGKR